MKLRITKTTSGQVRVSCHDGMSQTSIVLTPQEALNAGSKIIQFARELQRTQIKDTP
jgi:hypothetical protein